eukprot:6213842-Pleurochrysis_carterae.AAC.4
MKHLTCRRRVRARQLKHGSANAPYLQRADARRKAQGTLTSNTQFQSAKADVEMPMSIRDAMLGNVYCLGKLLACSLLANAVDFSLLKSLEWS